MTSVDTVDMGRAPTGLTLADSLRIARAHWKSILAFTLALTLAAFVWALLQPKTYSAQSTGIVVAGGSDNLSMAVMSDTLAKGTALKYQSVATSRLVAERVSGSMGTGISVDALLDSVTAEVPKDTAEIIVKAQSTDPATAQKIADAWVAGLAEQVKELESITVVEDETTATQPVVRVVPLGQAILPTSPTSPNTRMALGIGALGGLLLGLAYAFVRSHLDRRLRSAEAIERLFGVPVVGTIPADSRLDRKSTILESGDAGSARLGKGSHATTEALRELRTNLRFIDVDNPPRIIVVTSSVQSEGKSTVTANLAVTMAAAGENVVVVDGDLRRPTAVEVFNLIPGVGVTDVLSGHAELRDVLQPWGAMPNLQVLGSGRIPPNPSELLGSRAMKTMLDTLAKDAIVLIDAPPLLPVTDAAVLTRVSDGAIVVIRSGKTSQDELGKALGNLKRIQGKVLGTILNCVPTSGVGAYAYYAGYESTEAALPTVPVEEPAPTVSKVIRPASLVPAEFEEERVAVHSRRAAK